MHTLELEGPEILSYSTVQRTISSENGCGLTCCRLRSPSVCFSTCESGLKGVAHSDPEISP